MKTRIALATVALAAALASLPALAVEVAGVKLEDTAKVAGQDLKLNGAGVRTRAIFKVYAMGLYLGKKETSTDAVLATAGPRRISIVMLRDVSGEDFGQAFLTGINSNTDKAEKSKFVSQTLKLGEVFQAVGGLKKGDALMVDWVPGKGTDIHLNGKSISEPLPDLAFYNAILKIWLGDKPADSTLKPQLLGAKE
ncbi:MAG: chalcone isomerase family protein [Rubrivivax sp.]|nr:chalcone isomerase family protein [Rubrivivax sp.]